jgi:hypothetical protein
MKRRLLPLAVISILIAAPAIAAQPDAGSILLEQRQIPRTLFKWNW